MAFEDGKRVGGFEWVAAHGWASWVVRHAVGVSCIGLWIVGGIFDDSVSNASKRAVTLPYGVFVAFFEVIHMLSLIHI